MDCCGRPLEFKKLPELLIPAWRSYKPRVAVCPVCKTYYEKKPYRKTGYKQQGNILFCTFDGDGVEWARVDHPIHNGSSPDSGDGQVEYELVPYCAMCENKPISPGQPIDAKMWVDEL